MNETQKLMLANLALSLLAVLVNAIAPQIARHILSTAKTPEDWTRNWVQTTVEGPQKGQQKWAYALMDFYGQVTLTVVAMVSLWFQAVVVLLTSGFPATLLAGIVVGLDFVALLALLGMKGREKHIEDYCPTDPSSRDNASRLSQLKSFFGPPPPPGAWRNLRFTAIATSIILFAVQLVVTLT